MKKKSYAQLKKMVDHFFSVWIRRSREDLYGMVRCISCDAVEPWQQIQCGHFVSRVHLATRWDERNAAPQCKPCNEYKRGNLSAYLVWIAGEYGPGIMQELRAKANKTVKFHRSQLEGMIDDYKQRIANLGDGEVRGAGGQEMAPASLRLHGAGGDNS